MEKELTIYDLAKMMELSPATVSRALNNHPAINIKTRERVTEKAAELGYRSNTFASNLRRRTTQTLGVIVPRLNSHFMSSVLAGMEEVANRAGFNLLISQSLETERKEIANARTMFNGHVDGLLVSVASDTASFAHFQPFVARHIPVVFFDRILEHPSCKTIVLDNHEAGARVAEHLLKQGCLNFLHVAGSLARNVYQERAEGFRQRLIDEGKTLEIRETNLSAAEGADVALEWINMSPRPDGVFIANDVCAVAFLKQVIALGCRVPADVAIVGFNNDPLSEVVEPNLTTVEYPGHLMGQTAMKTMIAALNVDASGETIPASLIKSSLVVRASSKKVG